MLAVITVSFISNYGQKSLLQECNSYSNISSVTSNIIAVVLSVSVNTKPRSAPLRLFFFCWVCYSVAINTVFQAYLTTFLIEPRYEEPIKTVEQMLTSDMKFCFNDVFYTFFNDVPDSVDSAILNNAVRCPDIGTSFNWAAVYQNVSFVFENLNIEIYRDIGKLRDKNNKRLLCVLEDGGVVIIGNVLLVRRESPLLELINDILVHMVESGIASLIRKWYFPKEKNLPMLNAFAFDDTYTAFGVRHLQTAFYLLMLGYVLAFACFVIEIMWHRYRSSGCVPARTSLCHGRHT